MCRVKGQCPKSSPLCFEAIWRKCQWSAVGGGGTLDLYLSVLAKCFSSSFLEWSLGLKDPPSHRDLVTFSTLFHPTCCVMRHTCTRPLSEACEVCGLSRLEVKGKLHTCMFHWHQGSELGYGVLENIGFHGRNKFSSLCFSHAASPLKREHRFPQEVIHRDCRMESVTAPVELLSWPLNLQKCVC